MDRRKAAGKASSRKQNHAPPETKHKQSERATAEPWPGFFRQLMNTLEVGVAGVTPAGTIQYANRRFADVLGLGPVQLEGASLQSIVTAGSWKALETALREATERQVEGEVRVESEAGKPRVIQFTMSPVLDRGRAISVMATEVTELRDKTNALQQKEASLQTLSARILQLQDEERRRIARDLHDITGQELAAIALSLGQLARAQEEDHPERKQLVADAVGMVKKVEEEIRTLSYVLHPPLLDELGLSSALSWYTEGFQKRTGIEVRLKIPQGLRRLPPDEETALFRVVQEALTNVMRHSGAKKVWIEVTEGPSALHIAVRDEGKGIAPSKPGSPERKARLGVGILGMRERLRQLGGGLEIQSGPWGTEVLAYVPIVRSARIETEALPGAEPGGPSAAHVPGETSAKHCILIADDHEVTRQGIKTLLAEQPDLEVCGEAADGLEAIDKTRDLNPDLLILDLSMPGAGGLTVARRVRQIDPDTKILVFTTHSYPGLENMVKAAGCQGYVQKANASQELVAAARAILAGQEFYSPAKEAQSAVGSL
ncbi:MAG TPA: response regulator [Candidatus Acidoferrum sp.]|nr:response regulator [Candidatus Acidoferrum sp.]